MLEKDKLLWVTELHLGMKWKLGANIYFKIKIRGLFEF